MKLIAKQEERIVAKLTIELEGDEIAILNEMSRMNVRIPLLFEKGGYLRDFSSARVGQFLDDLQQTLESAVSAPAGPGHVDF